MTITLGRNEPCHCGSGKKYKKCHLEADEKSDRKDRERAALNAAKVASEAAEVAEADAKKNPAAKPPQKEAQPGWMQRVAGKVGMFKATQRRTPNKGG